jgi:hypothetical protein
MLVALNGSVDEPIALAPAPTAGTECERDRYQLPSSSRHSHADQLIPFTDL